MKPKSNCCIEFTPFDEGIFEVDDGERIATYCPKCECMKTLDWSYNLPYWETDLLTKVLLATNINSSSYASHPISGDLLSQSGGNLRKYEELIFNHLQKLEDTYGEHEEFTYELVEEKKIQFYNLYGFKK